MRRRDLTEHLIRLDAAAPPEMRLTVTSDGRRDAQTLPFFERQVEQIMARTYEREFPEFKAATGAVLPISNDIDEGAETFVYYVYEGFGIAEFVSSYGDKTLPQVTITGAEVTGRVRDYSIEYGWTTKDLRRAAFAGTPLQSRYAVYARRGADALFHETALWGREDIGLPGFINHPNITVTIAADNGAGSTFWVDKTVDQIVADVGAMIDAVVELTNEVERPNRLALPLSVYNLIKRRRLGAGDGNATILMHLESIWRDVEIYPLIDLQVANSRGNLTQGAAIAYTFDAEKVDIVEAMPFRQHAPQQDGLRWKVPCEAAMGGVRMPAPLSVIRMDGISAA